jgi:FMN phosphatase YigB (HAD superfamily)
MQTSKKIKLAIFDIDGTIFRSSLLIELINGLVNNGIFPKVALKEIQKEYTAWLNRKGSYDDYIQKVIDIHLKYIPNKNQVEVE